MPPSLVCSPAGLGPGAGAPAVAAGPEVAVTSGVPGKAEEELAGSWRGTAELATASTVATGPAPSAVNACTAGGKRPPFTKRPSVSSKPCGKLGPRCSSYLDSKHVSHAAEEPVGSDCGLSRGGDSGLEAAPLGLSGDVVGYATGPVGGGIPLQLHLAISLVISL